jgi:hypothetical protein
MRSSVPSPNSLGPRCVSKWAAGKARGARIQPHFFAPEDRQNKREPKKVGLDVTDEQRGRRPIFNATLLAVAS